MNLGTMLFAIALATCIIALILYLIFSWTTVRKLKKNPATKNFLGAEFISGWNVLNVAQAIAIPKLMGKLKHSPLSMLHADPDLLIKHTSRFDRILGKVFFWVFTFSGSFIILFVILDTLGVFN